MEKLLTLNVEDIEIFMISVPTPTKEGRVKLCYLKSALKTIGKSLANMKNFPIMVIRSTVPPGTTENLAKNILEKESGKKAGKDFGICMNPEFLRAVKAEEDFSNPWTVVIGSDDKKAGLSLSKIYEQYKCPIVHMTLKEAEMMKYAHNLLNATKISFFNEMRMVGNEIGVDPETIFPAVIKSAEAMWNPEYGIKNFGPYGGVCLPKDTEAFFTWAVDTLNFKMPVLKGTMQTNKLMQEEMYSKKKDEEKIDFDSYHIMPSLEEKSIAKEFTKKVKAENDFSYEKVEELPL
jgi:UDPglucose 6-dehydrogenase